MRKKDKRKTLNIAPFCDSSDATDEQLTLHLFPVKIQLQIVDFTMDKLQLTGQNLGRVFNFRSGHLHAAQFWCYRVKLLNLKLKTGPKQLLGSFPLVIALPDFTHKGLSVKIPVKLPKLSNVMYLPVLLWVIRLNSICPQGSQGKYITQNAVGVTSGFANKSSM